jgi:cytochrome c biogenesis protein CcmG, thiol:disulfide interchange protein DsbE
LARPRIGTHGLVLFLTAIALAAAGCGSSSDGKSGGHPDYEKALSGAPPALAALYDQANRLLPGGRDAYERRLATLEGYPAVANVWASWCGPCRFEFPHFQRAAARYGTRVAFLGIDTQDSDEAAATFLREEPVPYPSYTDPDEEIVESIGATRGLPDTAFYDRSGKLVYLKQGPYDDEAELLADVERYALRADGERDAPQADIQDPSGRVGEGG